MTFSGLTNYFRNAVQLFEGVLRSQHRVYDGSGEVARTQGVWGAEGISGRVKFLPLAWAGMPKTSFRKNSDSPTITLATEPIERSWDLKQLMRCFMKKWALMPVN